jgi:lipopolysaccharide transport system ATP-binding protein
MSWAIKVEGLSKKYKLGRGHIQKFDSLYQALGDAAIAAVDKLTFGKISEHLPQRIEEQPREIQSEHLVLSPTQFIDAPDGEFWALRDLTFQINAGDRVGIVGKNGSGKSTLLKILSRITPPTLGSYSYKGRLVSLLEVGTGFHPDLTGRENIYLNAKINGMSTREVRRSFDEIVDFSELGAQIDTPIKRYSSGMYMRLAFSVAAHLNSEILIVDEVLAVGDSGFQKKCMEKMLAIGNSGRTLLFVSHDMDAVRKVCSVALELAHGRIVSHDNTFSPESKISTMNQNHNLETGLSSVTSAIGEYSFGSSGKCEVIFDNLEKSQLPSRKLAISKLSLKNNQDVISQKFHEDESIQLAIDCIQFLPLERCSFVLTILLSSGRELLNTHSEFDFNTKDFTQIHKLICKIPSNFFNPGAYRVSLAFFDPDKNDDSLVLQGCLSFEIVGGATEKLLNKFIGESPINPPFKWMKEESA